MTRSNELRIFISSTFRDLQEEREHLVKKIFPEIRAICRQRGITFTEVDLRWGLTKEEVERGGVISICLEEIERCKPYFVGILGERYGWVPPDDHLRDPRLAIYPWLREEGASEQSITDMEIRYGALLHSRDEVDAFFYFRHPESTPADFAERDPQRVHQLEKLKASIRRSGFPVHEGFRTPEELGKEIKEDLLRVIEERFPEGEAPDPFEQERAAHEAFALARRRAYVPDDATLGRLQEFVDAGQQGIVVTAPSGAGKSALLAYWTSLYRAENPDDLVIEHYIGATAAGHDHHGLMLRVMTEISRGFGIDRSLPNTPEGIERAFPAWLGYARDRRLVIILDAVNQLPEQSRSLGWLPTHLPPTVRLVISTTESPTLDKMKDRGYAVVEVGALNKEQRRRLVETYLAQFRKKLLPEQLDRILSDERSVTPLFLRTVVEELRVFGVYEDLDRRIDDVLASNNLDDLFQHILARMEADYGPDLVQQSMSYLWASRSGLTESELLELLNREASPDGRAPAHVNRLDLSAFLLALDYHLMRNAGFLHFFHDYLRRAVEARYVGQAEPEGSREEPARKVAKRELHRRIALYLRERTSKAVEVSRRDARELAYQLDQAGDHQMLATTLSSLPHSLAMSRGEADIELLSYWAALRDQGFSPDEYYAASTSRYESEGAEKAELCAALQMEATLFERLGIWEGAMAVNKRQLQVATENDLPEQKGRALLGLGGLYRLLGENDHAIEHLEQARALLAELGNDHDATRALCTIGLVHTGRAEFDDALECLRRGSETYLQLGNRHGYAKSVGDMGSVYAMRGEFDRALESFQLQQKVCEESGDLNGLSNAVGNMGSVYLGLGEYDRALECYGQSLEMDGQLGDLRGAASVIGNMGIIYQELNEYDKAEECFNRRLYMCRELGDRSGAATAAGNLGLLYKDRGMYDRALTCLNEHRTVSEELGNQLGVATASGNLGMLYHSMGDYELSRSHLLENIAISRELGEQIGLARSIGNLGVLYKDTGEFQQAIECFREAVEMYRSMDSLHKTIDYQLTEARIMLDILESHEAPPTWIEEVLPGAAGEMWRPELLIYARSKLSEYRDLHRELDLPEVGFDGEIVEARILAREGKNEQAYARLHSRLSHATDDVHRADLHYWLWRLQLDPEGEHYASARTLYTTLLADTPDEAYRKRLEELQEATTQ